MFDKTFRLLGIKCFQKNFLLPEIQTRHFLKYILSIVVFFCVSDPPLEEDDIPDGEWLCNECKATPKEVGTLNKEAQLCMSVWDGIVCCKQFSEECERKLFSAFPSGNLKPLYTSPKAFLSNLTLSVTKQAKLVTCLQ